MKNIFLKNGQINVPMLRHHSTDGTARWGYAGSAPADTALSVLAQLLPLGTPTPDTPQARAALPGSHHAPVRLWDGSEVHPLAWALHQDFKREFLAGLDEDEAHELDGGVLEAWVQERLGITPEHLGGRVTLNLQGQLTPPLLRALGQVYQTLLEMLYADLLPAERRAVVGAVAASLNVPVGHREAAFSTEFQDFLVDPLQVLERHELLAYEQEEEDGDQVEHFVLVRGAGVRAHEYEVYHARYNNLGVATRVRLLSRHASHVEAASALRGAAQMPQEAEA